MEDGAHPGYLLVNVWPHVNDFLTLVSQVREHYLKALLSCFEEFKASHLPCALEVMFELKSLESLPFRLYRVDMAANIGGEAALREVDPSTHLSFEPFKLDAGRGLIAAVHPIVWNDISIKTDLRLPDEPIEAWAMRWLDMDDHHAQDENGLQGVIHSVSRDDTGEEGTALTVDFGSAPAEALKELIELLRTFGASYITLQSGRVLPNAASYDADG